MGAEKRRWVWVIIVAVVAAVVWWLVPQGTSPSQEPAAETKANDRERAQRAAPVDPLPAAGTRPASGDAERADAPPTAEPLPRDEVALPPTPGAGDAGVPGDAAGDPAARREAMLTTVLDRLREDLRAAEDANDEEQAARLRVRIERLEARRQELGEP